MLMVPILISLIVFKRNKQIKWVYGGIVFTLIMTMLAFFTLITIRFPDNTFYESDFEETYEEIFFKMELPNEYNLIAKDYEKGSGLFGHETWTARLSFNEKDYTKLLNYVKNENQMLLEDHTDNPLTDCKTGDKIIYSIATSYMNPWNYNIDFFEDNKTFRLTMIVYGD